LTTTRPATTATTVAACFDVRVVHGRGEAAVVALDGVSLDVGRGERIAIWGRSGSGKSTLLHVLGGLLAPTAGSVEWHGIPVATLDEATRRGGRATGIAFIFQRPNLLPVFTARENVRFAARNRPGADVAGADELLTLVGLGAKAAHLPDELSGGEQQRVAIARALAQEPELVLADEPTGHLDSDTARRVLDLIDTLQERLGFALVCATHERDLVPRFPRELALHDGRVVEDERQ
jgi:ABC-type lipoprotein export system ATPase subunit